MAARAASAKGQPGASRRKPCRLQLRTSHEEAWENNPTRSPRGSSRTALSWCLQMGRLERRGGRGPPAAPQAAAPRAQRPAHTACAWAGALVWNRAVDRAHRRWAEPAAGRGAHPSAQPCGGSPSTHLLDVSRQVFRGKRQGRSPGHTGWAGGPWSHPKPSALYQATAQDTRGHSWWALGRCHAPGIRGKIRWAEVIQGTGGSLPGGGHPELRAQAQVGINQ